MIPMNLLPDDGSPDYVNTDTLKPIFQAFAYLVFVLDPFAETRMALLPWKSNKAISPYLRLAVARSKQRRR
jgi:hypothetical protein